MSLVCFVRRIRILGQYVSKVRLQIVCGFEFVDILEVFAPSLLEELFLNSSAELQKLYIIGVMYDDGHCFATEDSLPTVNHWLAATVLPSMVCSSGLQPGLSRGLSSLLGQDQQCHGGPYGAAVSKLTLYQKSFVPILGPLRIRVDGPHSKYIISSEALIVAAHAPTVDLTVGCIRAVLLQLSFPLFWHCWFCSLRLDVVAPWQPFEVRRRLLILTGFGHVDQGVL